MLQCGTESGALTEAIYQELRRVAYHAVELARTNDSGPSEPLGYALANLRTFAHFWTSMRPLGALLRKRIGTLQDHWAIPIPP